MQKNARWGQNAPATTVVDARGNMKAHELFGGKTLSQVGAELNLGDEQVGWGFSTNPKNQEEIMSLLIKNVNGVNYQIPLSRGLSDNEELLKDANYLLNCTFRVGHLSVKDDTGAPKVDERGDVVLDTNKPYISFGAPSGLRIEREEAMFGEPVKAQVVA